MANETKVRMNTKAAVALDDAVEGARRATGDASFSAPPNPEVAATARRRQFSMEERLRILALADACTEPGDIGALLRREGIYSSHLTTWRKQRTAAELAALAPQKRGRKADPALAEARRLDQLTRENDRLRRQLAQAHTIIDVQKKVCTLLGLLADETPDGKS
jgi:transposase-like protein